jgi:hypothetical protein
MSASWPEIKGAFQGLNLTIRGVRITITPTSTYSAKKQVARLEHAISSSLSTSKLDWVTWLAPQSEDLTDDTCLSL